MRIQATLRKLALVLRKLYHSECHCPSSHSALPFRSQTFDVVLDTGSSDLWFASTNCVGCVQTGPEFDPQKSSTLQQGNQRITLNYGSGTAVGTIAQDTVTMGPFTVNPQTFGAFPQLLEALFPGIGIVKWLCRHEVQAFVLQLLEPGVCRPFLQILPSLCQQSNHEHSDRGPGVPRPD